MARTAKPVESVTTPVPERLAPAAAPWLADSREQLRAALAAGRLPHALLVLAPAGCGESALGWWAAQLALCDQEPAAAPCGTCTACKLFLAANHPDFVSVELEDSSKVLKVDQIREVTAGLALTSFRGRRKVAVIDPADRMNTSSFNALLKTLEEPSRETLLVLVANRLDRLPRTVISRCQRLSVRLPATDVALAWLDQVEARSDWQALLALAGGGPVRAVELARGGMGDLPGSMAAALEAGSRQALDPLQLAQVWFQDRPADRLAWLEAWTVEQIRELTMAVDAARVSGGDRLPKGPAPMNIRAAFNLLDRIRAARAVLETSLNTQLLFEDLMICLAEACAGRGGGRMET